MIKKMTSMMLRATNILKSHFTSLGSRISRISPLYWNISFPFSFPGRPSVVPLSPLLCLPCLLFLFPLLLISKCPTVLSSVLFSPPSAPAILALSTDLLSLKAPLGLPGEALLSLTSPSAAVVPSGCRHQPPRSCAPTGKLPAKPPCLPFFPLESSFPDFHVTCSLSPSQLLFTCRAFLDLCPSICPCPFRPWALYLFTG